MREDVVHGNGLDRRRPADFAHRLNLHTQIIRLLLTMIPDQRAVYLREDPSEYHAEPPNIPHSGISEAFNPLEEVPFS